MTNLVKPAPRTHLLILFLLLTLHFTVNHFIISRSLPLWQDADAFQAMEARQHAGAIKNYGLLKTLGDARKIMLHPQIYQLSLGILASRSLPEKQEDLYPAIELANGFFIALLILAIYGIGRTLYGPQEGLLAAALLSFSPVIFGQSRLPMLELPSAALICLFFYVLLKTRGFTSLPLSLLAGLIFALAALTKETAFVFLIPILAAYSAKELITGSNRKKRQLNLYLLLAVSILPLLSVYLNPENRPIYYRYWQHVSSAGYPHFSYLQMLKPYYLGWICFWPVIPLLLAYFINLRKRNAVITAWLLVSWLAFSLIGFKTVRFLIPALPALYLILAVEALRFPYLKKLYPGAVIAMFAYQFACLNSFLPAKGPGFTPYSVNEAGLLSVERNPMVDEANRLALFLESCGQKRIELASLTYFYYRSYLQLILTLHGQDFRLFEAHHAFKTQDWLEYCKKADFLLEETSSFQPEQLLIIGKDQTRIYRDVCLPLFEPAKEFKSKQYERPAILHVYEAKRLLKQHTR